MIRQFLRGIARWIDRVAPILYRNEYECTDCECKWCVTGGRGDKGRCPVCGLDCCPDYFGSLPE